MDDLIQQGANALKSGDLETARRLLAQAVKQQPDNERAWGWMYNACNTGQERIHCLKQILRINPHNEKANQALNELIGFTAPLETPRAQAIPGQPTPWYRSQAAYLVFFLFITPLWAYLIVTDKKQSGLIRGFALLVAGVYLAACCYWFYPTTIQNAEKCLQVSYHCAVGTANSSAGGSVKNVCDRALKGILLRAQMYDSAGNIIGSNLGTINSDILYPGATSEFLFYAEANILSYDHCSISVENAFFGE